MKNLLKTSLLITFLVLSFSQLNAQYLSYGAKLGLSFPGFQNEELASSRIVYSTGIVGTLNFSDFFNLNLELDFDKKGAKYDNAFVNPGETDSTLNKTKLDYFSIPVYMKVNFGRSNKLYFQAGAYYGLLLNARYTGPYNGEDVKRMNVRDQYTGDDYGLVLGGGIETRVHSGLSILLDLKYNYGLKNIDALGGESPIKNRNMIMSLGFLVHVN